MKTNDYNDDDGVSLLNGPVSTLAVMWFVICLGFIAYVFIRIFAV